MKILVTFVTLCVLFGCVTTEEAQQAAERREYDRVEEVHKFLERERKCRDSGGQMNINTIGTRIRRPYTTIDMKLARCVISR